MILLVLAVMFSAPATAATAERYVVHEGDVTIEYVQRGAGPGILMIPSLGRSAEDFDVVANKLADSGFMTICPEPRGIGKSASSMPPRTLHDLARDAAMVARHVHKSQIVVLGHAFGGSVARTFATDHPELVRGVILLAASGRVPISNEVKTAIQESSDVSLPAAQRLKQLQISYFAPGNDAGLWLSGWYPDVQAQEWKAFQATSPVEYVTAGQSPILDIQGAEDAILPKNHALDLKHELGARVTVVVVPRAGHALVPEQPQTVTDAIKRWMVGLR